MADRLDAVLTPSNALGVGKAMTVAWWRLWHEVPERWSILVLLAQSGLETAEWKRMLCYSLGGVKSRDGDGYDYTYFSTTECVSAASASAMVAKSGTRTDGLGGQDVEIVGLCTSGKTKVKLHPSHPGCRFRAYRALEEAAIDHLAMLKSHKAFGRAWPAVLSGSPESYAELLKQARYFTAPVEEYRTSLKFFFTKYSKLDLIPSAIVQQHELQKEALTQEERDRASAIVALSLTQLVDSMAGKGWK